MPITLPKHLDAVPADIKKLVLLIARQTKQIRTGFLTHTALAGSKNVYGEEQLKLDKWADKLVLSAMEESSIVKSAASEEQEKIVEFSKSIGSFGITVDPLDGVSCVSTNLSVGTIVGIFREGNVLEKGNKMDAAMFVLYGPVTTLVYAFKKRGVHEFVFDEKKQEFVLRRENIKIPAGKIFGSGGQKPKWTVQHRKFIGKLEKQGYKLRFSGSLTADFNQVLHYGGLFCYPGLTDKPEGKLRLLFEGNPLSFIAREAGGASTNGQKSILEVKPKKISDRTPLYLGGKKEIELAEKFLRK